MTEEQRDRAEEWAIYFRGTARRWEKEDISPKTHPLLRKAFVDACDSMAESLEKELEEDEADE